MADRIILQRMQIMADTLNTFYLANFIQPKHQLKDTMNVYEDYIKLMSMSIDQGFTPKMFNVDAWWDYRNDFSGKSAEAVQLLSQLERKVKLYTQEKQLKKAHRYLKAFKEKSSLVSILLFQGLYGKERYFAVYKTTLMYREDVHLP